MPSLSLSGSGSGFRGACGSPGHGLLADGGSGAACDHAITTASCWTIVDASSAMPPMMTGYAGSTFDGRYAYFAPYIGVSSSEQYMTSGAVRRLDTTADLPPAAAWSTFDATTVTAGAQGFFGAVFDGRYVYFLPNFTGQPFGGPTATNGVVARYDTMATFGDATAWKTFDTAPLGGGGFGGGTFDGRYLYFVTAAGIVARYDTTADFATAGSWLVVHAAIATSTPDLAARGAIYDGHYLYFVPSTDGENDRTSVLARLDPAAPDLTAATAWTTFDTLALNRQASFAGGAFDGRYLYLAPLAGAPIARFDTTADFATMASWSTFDPAPLASGPMTFAGAAFDGRFVYFVPGANGNATNGDVIRYDTTADFATMASWSSFDTSALDSTATDYGGAVFDGRYVTFEPNSFAGAFARFDAVEPAAEPALPDFHGSFL